MDPTLPAQTQIVRKRLRSDSEAGELLRLVGVEFGVGDGPRGAPARLDVDLERMRSNLDFTDGLVFSERVTTLLAEVLGKAAAFALVQRASEECYRTNRPLRVVLSALITAGDIPRSSDRGPGPRSMTTSASGRRTPESTGCSPGTSNPPRARGPHYDPAHYPRHGHAGTGLSPAARQPVTVAEVADVVITLVDLVGGGAFHYAGVSFGGAVGLELALHHPADGGFPGLHHPLCLGGDLDQARPRSAHPQLPDPGLPGDRRPRT
ncbi:hypothetical protein E3T34_05080 [Cryobacterium sp. TMT1-62]|nr:hypothetical protein E3T34_05080 [Cryobacterium sp. TMT1-62]